MIHARGVYEGTLTRWTVSKAELLQPELWTEIAEDDLESQAAAYERAMHHMERVYASYGGGLCII